MHPPLAKLPFPDYAAPMWRYVFIGLALAAGALTLSGCGLVRAPFRVGGALVGHGYQTGKAVAKKTSKLFEGDKEDQKRAKSDDAKAKTAAASPPVTGQAAAGGELPAAAPAPARSGSPDAGLSPPPLEDLPPLDQLPPLDELPPL